MDKNVQQNNMPVNGQADLQTFLDQIEGKLLDHISEGLRGRSLTVEQAEQLARDFLAKLPAKDKEDLLIKLNELGQTYRPAQQTYVEVGLPFEEQKRQETLNVMRDHIKSGQIEQAIQIAKGG